MIPAFGLRIYTPNIREESYELSKHYENESWQLKQLTPYRIKEGPSPDGRDACIPCAGSKGGSGSAATRRA